MGQPDAGTLSRAHALLPEGCPACPMGHKAGGTGHMGRDTSVACDVTPPADAGVATPRDAAVAKGRNREGLSADPRFAAWEAGAPALTLGPSLEDIPSEAAERALARRREEQAELMRIAAQSALDRSNGGKTLTREARAWALKHAATPPLKRPLGTGEPTT
jgi:hypothetical protein